MNNLNPSIHRLCELIHPWMQIAHASLEKTRPLFLLAQRLKEKLAPAEPFLRQLGMTLQKIHNKVDEINTIHRTRVDQSSRDICHEYLDNPMSLIFENPDIKRFVDRTIRWKAKQLVKRPDFRIYEIEDIEQELWSDLIARLKKYDHKRGEFQVFIRMVVNRRVATMIEAQKAGIRSTPHQTYSLYDQIIDGSGDPKYLYETLDQESSHRLIGFSYRSETDLNDLTIDVHSTTENLPPKHRKLCELLQYMNVAEIVRATGIHRSTAYEQLRMLNYYFSTSGLKEYL